MIPPSSLDKVSAMRTNTCAFLSAQGLLLLLLLTLTPHSSTSKCTTNPCKPTIPAQPALKPPSYRPRGIPPKLPPANPFCPRDTLKLGACGNVLGAANIVIGTPPSGTQCCAVLGGLSDAEAAACICTAIKANVLGVITAKLPVALSLLLSSCKRGVPAGFKCA